MGFLNINTQNLPQEEKNYDPIPEGWYRVTLKESELKDTKRGDGQYIHNKFLIVSPTHVGRFVFGNINISNKNAMAEEIGLRNLGELCRAIGFNGQLTNTDQLIGHEIEIKVKIREGKDGYEPSNDIVGYRAVKGASSIPTKSAPASQTSQEKAKAAPPWDKR